MKLSEKKNIMQLLDTIDSHTTCEMCKTVRKLQFFNNSAIYAIYLGTLSTIFRSNPLINKTVHCVWYWRLNLNNCRTNYTTWYLGYKYKYINYKSYTCILNLILYFHPVMLSCFPQPPAAFYCPKKNNYVRQIIKFDFYRLSSRCEAL